MNYKRLATISLILLVVMIGFLINFTFQVQKRVNELEPNLTKETVVIKVEYNGEWQGAYGDLSKIVSWNGNGVKTLTLNRPNDAHLWIVSVNAQKMDDSSQTLTIKIMLNDGTVLKQASTTSPYGIAQIADTID